MITENDRIECRKVQVRMLDALKLICDKHNLQYWLDFGTLLGAVRHKGFIPWDDDIDVSMSMEDYKKFISIAKKELPRDIFLQVPNTDPGFKDCYAKLRDCHSTFLEHHETGNESYHEGIYIDIFPYISYPKMPRLLKKVLLYITVRARHKAVVKRENVFLNYTAYLLAKFIFLIFSPFKSDIVGRTHEDNGYYESIPREYLYPLKPIEFEGKLYSGPSNVPGYLTALYGKNYITPPPENQRVPHAKAILLHTPCKHPHAIKQKHEQ